MCVCVCVCVCVLITLSLSTSGEWDSIMFLTASKSLVIHPLNPVRALLSWSICFVFIFNRQQRQIEENNTRNKRSNHVAGHHVRFRKRWHTTKRHHITIWLQLARFNCINRNKVEQLSTDLSLAISHVSHNPMIPHVPSSKPLHHFLNLESLQP